MTDDRFRLTALDVRRFTFDAALRGYDRERVDDFREQVAEEMERLTRENHELAMRARTAVEQLSAFRDREAALNEALVSAQEMRGTVREQAEREAHSVVRDAQAAVELQLREGREAVRRVEEELQQLWNRRTLILAAMREQAERHLQELIMAERQPVPSVPTAPTVVAAPVAPPPVVAPVVPTAGVPAGGAAVAPPAPTMPTAAIPAPAPPAPSSTPAPHDLWSTPAPEAPRRRAVRPPAWLVDDA